MVASYTDYVSTDLYMRYYFHKFNYIIEWNEFLNVVLIILNLVKFLLLGGDHCVTLSDDHVLSGSLQLTIL